MPEVFHSLQLVTHAWQPTHTFRSMTSASCVIVASPGEIREPCGPDGRRARERRHRLELRERLARARRPRRGGCARARRTTPAWPVTGSELEMRRDPAPPLRKLVGDQVVQQEPAPRLVGVGVEPPRARRLADRVPRPHGARLDRFRVARHAAHLAPRRLDPHPAAVGDALRRARSPGSRTGSCGCGSGAATRSASPTSGTSPSAAG